MDSEVIQDKLHFILTKLFLKGLMTIETFHQLMSLIISMRDMALQEQLTDSFVYNEKVNRYYLTQPGPDQVKKNQPGRPKSFL